MELPIKAFWLMNDNVDRVSAKSDMRSLMVAGSVQSFEASKSYRERLVLEVGTMVTFETNPILDAVRDEDGFAELRKMANQ